MPPTVPLPALPALRLERAVWPAFAREEGPFFSRIDRSSVQDDAQGSLGHAYGVSRSLSAQGRQEEKVAGESSDGSVTPMGLRTRKTRQWDELTPLASRAGPRLLASMALDDDTFVLGAKHSPSAAYVSLVPTPLIPTLSLSNETFTMPSDEELEIRRSSISSICSTSSDSSVASSSSNNSVSTLASEVGSEDFHAHDKSGGLLGEEEDDCMGSDGEDEHEYWEGMDAEEGGRLGLQLVFDLEEDLLPPPVVVLRTPERPQSYSHTPPRFSDHASHPWAHEDAPPHADFSPRCLFPLFAPFDSPSHERRADASCGLGEAIALREERLPDSPYALHRHRHRQAWLDLPPV